MAASNTDPLVKEIAPDPFSFSFSTPFGDRSSESLKLRKELPPLHPLAPPLLSVNNKKPSIDHPSSISPSWDTFLHVPSTPLQKAKLSKPLPADFAPYQKSRPRTKSVVQDDLEQDPFSLKHSFPSSIFNGSKSCKHATRSNSVDVLQGEPESFVPVDVLLLSNSFDGATFRKLPKKEKKKPAKLHDTNQSPFRDNEGFDALLPPQLPHLEGRITLVLDIDETLVHTSSEEPATFDFIISYKCNGHREEMFVRMRPHLSEFLSYAEAKFEVVIFTAGINKYAHVLIRAIEDRCKVRLPLRLSREHCSGLGEGTYVKDLHLLGRPLHRTVLMDNTPTSYRFQKRNGLPVVSWFDDEADDELNRLMMFVLPDLAECDDVYPLLDQHNA